LKSRVSVSVSNFKSRDSGFLRKSRSQYRRFNQVSVSKVMVSTTSINMTPEMMSGQFVIYLMCTRDRGVSAKAIVFK